MARSPSSSVLFHPARQDGIPMSLSFAGAERSEVVVGRTPGSAADALVGLPGLEEADFTGEERVQGDPRRPGGLPHDCIWIPGFGETKRSEERRVGKEGHSWG